MEMKSVLYVLCFFAHFVYCSSNAYSEDPISIMSKLSTEYNTLSGPSFDILGHLMKISEKAKLFLKLTGPAGSILAAGAELILPHDHPVLKSLEYLRKHMDRKFSIQNHFIEGALSTLRAAQDLNEYDTEVNVPLDGLSEVFEKMIDPTKTKKTKDEFVYVCTRCQSTPKELLRYINRKVNANCQTNKTQNILPVISELKAEFDKVFDRISEQKYTTNYATFFTIYIQILELFESLSEKEANETFLKLREVFTKALDTPEIDLFDLNDSILDNVQGPITETCLLRSVYESHQAKREELVRFVEIVTRDTLKIAMIGGFCANLSFSGDAEKIEEELDILGTYIKNIAGNMFKWVNKELDDAWPHEIIRNIEKVITRDVTDPYAYNYTAARINNEAMIRGPFGFVSQVLVSQNWDYISNFWFLCLPQFCAYLKHFHLINFVIMRHETGAEQRASLAIEWFEANKNAIEETIRNNDKIADLGSMIAKIEENTGPVTDQHRFHSFVIQHISVMSSKSTVIPIGLSTNHFMNYSGYGYVEVYSHHWFPKNEELFKLFLFL